MTVVEFLDAHAGFAATMVTLVLVIITAYYAKQTHDQASIARAAVSEARRQGSDQVAAQFRPMLVPRDPPSGMSPAIPAVSETQTIVAQLVIDNIGTGPALNGALQVVRMGVPGEPRPPLMMQFAQVPFGIVGVNRAVEPRVVVGSGPFMFMNVSNAAITDELAIEYQSLAGRWYRTVVTLRGGRWWNCQQMELTSGPASRNLDEEELRRRSSIGI